MKILLTGSHFTPALAVCEELKKEKDIQLVYVGRNTTDEENQIKSVESNEFAKIGVKFIPLTIGKLQRYFSIYSFFSFLKVPVGFLHAFIILLFVKPDAVLSFGGYVGLPLVVTSWLLSIPVIIHEQSFKLGLANKISSFFADKIALSFDGRGLSAKVILTGNPLRGVILNYKKVELSEEYTSFFSNAKKEKKKTIFITGGNQGSHVINKSIEKSLLNLSKRYYLIHQAGDSKHKDFDSLKVLQSRRYIVKKWIGKEIGKLMSLSDLIICRSGMNTLLEINFLGKNALVVPIPYQKEQTTNADYFKKKGHFYVLPQSKLSPKNLILMIEKILKIDSWSRPISDNFNVDAAKRLALEVLLLAKTDK